MIQDRGTVKCNDKRFGEWRSQLFQRDERNVNKVTHCHNVNFENRALFKSYSRRQQLIANRCNKITLRESGASPDNTGATLNHFYVSNSFGSSRIYNNNKITREFIQRPEAEQKNNSQRSMYYNSDIVVVSGKSTATIGNPPKQAPPNYKRISNAIDLYLKILPFHRLPHT